MQLFNFARRTEGGTCPLAWTSLYLDNIPATRLGIGLRLRIPFKKRIQPDILVFSGDPVPHIFFINFHFRWRAKHIDGRRMFFTLVPFWIPTVIPLVI